MPYAREHRVVSHFQLKHWTPLAKASDMFLKLPVSNFIKTNDGVVSKRSRVTCLHCGQKAMNRHQAGEHMCIDPDQGGSPSCLTRCPQGRRMVKLDVLNLFQIKEVGTLCYLCGSQFSDVICLDVHLHNVHQVVTARLQEHKCEICGAMFPNRVRLIRHQECRHVSGEKRIFACEFCEKTFAARSRLSQHRQVEHIVGYFRCQYCPRKFSRRSNWMVHTRRHLGETPHQCKICGKDFTSLYNLKTHERIHTGERPYQCKQCDAAFAQKNSLDVHMKKHKDWAGLASQTSLPYQEYSH